MKRRFAGVVLLPFCLASHLVIGQEQAPLQADVQLQVKYNDKRPVLFRARLEGGGAVVRGSILNLPGGETALVVLHFDYNTGGDIALDELISQIVVLTSERAGNEFSKVTIDPNTVYLNLNRSSLSYSPLFTDRLETVETCTSSVFRYSEITSSSRAQTIRRLEEIQPSPNRFDDLYIVVIKK